MMRTAAAAFGLRLGAARASAAGPDRRALEQEMAGVLRGLPRGGIVLLTGASGSGKSARLAAARRVLKQRAVDGILPHGASGSLVDLAGPGNAADRLGRLARVGLGEASLAVRPLSVVSCGERARLEIAVVLGRLSEAPDEGAVRWPRWALVDEFCSALDRPMASVVAACTHRAVRGHAATGNRDGDERGPVGLIAATAHSDVERWLSPDVVVRCDADGPARVERRSGRRPTPLRVRIDDGSIDDYAALARHHYVAGPPATCERVLVARPAGGHAMGEPPLGVLVVSRPVLNARWRELAWPGRYGVNSASGLTPSRAATRINRELRCISRVVVHPRARGCGVASSLVRAYLAEPLTPMTEAVAAMGWVSPFFERAGMTPFALPRRAADRRLIEELAAGEVEPEDLIDDDAAAGVLGDARLKKAVLRWGRTVGAALPKRLRGTLDDAEGVLMAAAVRVGTNPVAYAHTAG